MPHFDKNTSLAALQDAYSVNDTKMLPLVHSLFMIVTGLSAML